MGGVKQAWIEEQERGWYSIDEKYVCANCFEDNAICEFIQHNATEHTCSYCGENTEEPSGADMNEVMALIFEGICEEWADPNNEGMSYETREGGWLGKVVDSWELLQDEICIAVNADELFKDIFDSISDRQWCQKNLYRLLPQDSLRIDWGNFCQRIKHFSRYVFYKLDENHNPTDNFDDDRPTSMILDDIGGFVTKNEMVRNVNIGELIYRVRLSDPKYEFSTIQELGPPSEQMALFSNRMSPAGIPMFYGAFDTDTALKETGRKSDAKASRATIAVFEVIKPFTIVDLTKVPFTPSLFDREKREARPGCIFLNNLLDDITQPVEKDGREHIDFVPTQVVTEYFRHLFRMVDDNKVMGMAYPSAVNQGGVSCVLFMTSAPGEGQLAFDEYSVEKWLTLQEVSTEVLKK